MLTIILVYVTLYTLASKKGDTKMLFLTVTNTAIKKLKPKECLLISLLDVLTKKGTTTTNATNQELADEISVTRQYITRAISSFKERDFITITRRYGRREIGLNQVLYQSGLLLKSNKKKPKK